MANFEFRDYMGMLRKFTKAETSSFCIRILCFSNMPTKSIIKISKNFSVLAQYGIGYYIL